mgnify:CR=1 FL=1
MKNKSIKFNEPFKSTKIKKYVNESLNLNYYSTGIFEEKCKELLKNKFNINNSLITHSATGALELIAMYLKMKNNNSKAFMPSYTFSSTANAFLRSGFNIEFLDVNLNDLMVNLREIKNIKDNDIIVPVHYSGQSIDFSHINNFSKNIIVEDAAQGLGTKWKNKQIGTIGNFGAISFHHTKNIQSGFGGLLISKFKEPMEKIQYIYERGTDRKKVTQGLKSKYEWVELGSSFQIPDLLSAVLLGQLEDFDIVIKKRRSLFNFYKNYFESFDSSLVRLPKFSIHSKSNFHAFYLIFNNSKHAQKFIAHNLSYGIDCYIGYVPLHNSKYGKKIGLNKQLLNTEKISKCIVRLPMHTNINEQDKKYLAQVFNKFFKI